MGYIKNKHSVNAEKAYLRGLMPISRVTKRILSEVGWEDSVAFFVYLCKSNYIKHQEMHHTTFMYKETKFYNLGDSVEYAKKLDLESLKRIYLKKSTKQDILKEKKVDYVTVLFSRKLMRAKADKAIDCIQFNGFYWWGTTICINTDSNKIMYVKQHEFGEKNLWYCKNKRAIEQEIIMFKELKFKPLK